MYCYTMFRDFTYKAARNVHNSSQSASGYKIL